MSTLYLFSSNRALQHFYTSHAGKLPSCFLWGEFLGQCFVMPHKKALPLSLRNIFLSHAALSVDVSALEFDKQFLDFLEQSHFIFPFLDELASALVDLKTIEFHDTYGEYEDHLRILTQLQDAYLDVLDRMGFYDPILQKSTFLPHFIKPYDRIEFFVDGFLSPHEKHTLEHIASSVKLSIHFHTDTYNVGHFEHLCGCHLEMFRAYVFDFTAKCIVEEREEQYTKKVQGYAFDSSLGQVALCLEQIQEWVDLGIDPAKIAVVLPSESFKESLKLFDVYCNFNYAMGESFTREKAYLELENIMQELKGDITSSWLHECVSWQGVMGLKRFGKLLSDVHPEAALLVLEVSELFESATLILEQRCLAELLHLVLLELKNRRVDDVFGGKVRVMGVLETRGLDLDAVIVVDMNDGLVPKANEKDLFLNSTMRQRLGLPTYKDRENLQKHYYLSLLRRCEKAVISWVSDEQNDVSNLVLESQFMPEIDIEIHNGEALYAHRLFGEMKEFHIKQDHVQGSLPIGFKLSYSKLKKYLQCPLAFYYAYIQDIKEPDLSDALNMGIAVHMCLEKSYQTHEDPLLREQMFNELLARVADNEYDRFSLELVTLYMKDFFKKERERSGEKILFIEKDFECDIFGFSFQGKMDRVSEYMGDIIVVDYKLSRNIDQYYLKNDATILQFTIYKKALESMGYTHIRAYLCHLYSGEWFEIDTSQGDALLLQSLEALKHCQEFIATPSLACYHCAYADLCGIAYE